eukprot:TRINITY_DN12399_c0_g1_i1.p2 TRINITY_DN12399_c0_g1~~TRINITY_DN12399_c0_g1_i1.p2  ORF type:complete len:104 (+),score=2.91 TRINITY_DN12399_c0_g1_i1:566-877(+)
MGFKPTVKHSPIGCLVGWPSPGVASRSTGTWSLNWNSYANYLRTTFRGINLSVMSWSCCWPPGSALLSLPQNTAAQHKKFDPPSGNWPQFPAPAPPPRLKRSG